MSTNKKESPIINFGSSLLLAVFLILCLVTFAVLALSSAANDYEFSRKLALRKTAYYEANNQAEELLKEIDCLLSEGCDWKQTASLSTDTISITAEIDDNNIPVISYSVPLDNAQALSVCLELSLSGKTESSNYQIRRWQIVSTAEWKGDDSLTLIYNN